MITIPNDTHAAPVLGLYVEPRAQAYYRLAVPLGVIGGAVTRYADSPEAQGAAHTVVLSRVVPLATAPPNAGAVKVAQLRGDGRRVLIDLDDSLDIVGAHVTPEWGAWARRHLETMIRAADGVITTNTTLAGRLRGLNRDIRVVPNYVRPGDWPALTPPDDGPPWLLVTGSASHDADWAEIVPALCRHQGRYRLRVAGHLPRYLAPFVTEHRRGVWGDLAAYQTMIAGCQIALCPLPRTAFNVCKSPIKLYEAALSGCAVLASETQYGPVLRAAGLHHAIATIPAQWGDLLGHYLDRPAKAADDAAALRAYVTDHLDVERHADTIRAAYAA